MINKRIFGADIPVHVKKKLEARQLVAEGGKLPGDTINSDYKDSRKNAYSYDELIRSDFEMEADLSSRTPFVRMWTAVSIVSKIDPKISDAEKKSQGLTDAEVQQGYQVIDKKTYIINSNNLSAVHGLDPLESVTFTDYFQNELEVDNDSNKFLKQQAGITGVTSETGGTLGSIKTTSISFKVNNFADFNEIYSKYFLKPGAQLFVDFGWNTISDLYDPDELFDVSKGIYPKTKLYGTKEDPKLSKDGIVAREKGDLEVLVGIVTKYNSKINEDGTVDCEVEITSKNSAMMMAPKLPTKSIERTSAKFAYELEKIVKYEAVYNLAGLNGQKKILDQLDKANTKNDATTFVEFEDTISELAFNSFGSKHYTPTTMALESGVFLVGDDATSTEQYLSWGFLEDNVFNKYFGHGDDTDLISSDSKGKFEVALDSSQSFTRFLDAMVARQSDDIETPKSVVPKYWDRSWQNRLNDDGGKSGRTLKQRRLDFIKTGKVDKAEQFDKKITSLKKSWDSHLDEMNKKAKKLTKGQELHRSDKFWQGEGGKYLITDYDKKLNRIPIREVFINLEVVINAFQKPDNDTMKKIIDEILEELNDDVYGVWDWALASDGDDNTLAVIDRNYLGIKTENPADDFDKLFTFNLMSKNSIVTSYDVSLSMPDGEIGSMYAIQAMSGTNKKMYPMSKEIERQSALASLLGKVGDNNQDNLRFRYLPDIQPFNAMMQNEDQLGNPFLDLYKDADGLVTKKSGAQNNERFAHILDVTDTFDTHMGSSQKSGTDDQAKEDAKNLRIEAMQEQRARDSGTVFISSADEKYKYEFTGEFNDGTESKPYPLPLELSLTTYGIATLQPGDIFKVDYLPKVYLDTCYFQITKVSHKVDMSGWYTTLETQFRIRPDYTDNELLLKSNEVLTNIDPVPPSTTPQNNAPPPSTNTTMNKKAEPKKEDKVQSLGKSTYMRNKLLPKIKDDQAYLWESDAQGFATWTDEYKKSAYRIPSEKHLGQDYQNSGWSFVSVKSFKMAKKVGKKYFNKEGEYDIVQDAKGPSGNSYNGFKKGAKVYNVRDFKDLINYMDVENGNIIEDMWVKVSTKVSHLEGLIKFTVGGACKPGELIYVHHPMYYWDDTLKTVYQRYNGYGYSRVYAQDYDDDNPVPYGYTRAIYRYGQKVYWGYQNQFKDNTHWFTAPGNLNLTNLLQVYDINSNDSRWKGTTLDKYTMNPDITN